MNEEITIDTHVSNVSYLIRALSHTHEDLASANGGQPLIYNLDFSLICPVLFHQVGEGSKPFLPDVKRWMPRVLEPHLERVQVPYTLFMSGVTFIEFLDQVKHHTDGLERRAEEVLSLDPAVLSDRSMPTTEALKKDLSLLNGVVYDAAVTGPIRRLRQLLEDCALNGIGDLGFAISDIPRDEYMREFKEAMEAQVRERREFGSGRKPQDAVFHYKVDAANVSITKLVTRYSDRSLSFVTNTDLNRRLVRDGDRFLGRIERVPLYLLGVKEVEKKGYIAKGNGQEFLRQGIALGKSLMTELDHFGSIDELPNHTVRRLDSFYMDYIAMLEGDVQWQEDLKSSISPEEARAALSNPKALRERMQAAAADMRTESTQLVHDFAENLGLVSGIIESFRDDPIYRKLVREFGL
jgi:hypothetical protein